VTGATVIQADALDSRVIRNELPLLALALPWVGHFQTRNAGTLGGSVAHADPSAEIPLCLVVSDATVVLRGRRRERRVRAREFFTGALSTVREPDELVVALDWPRAQPEASHAFEEIAQRHGDFAIAAAACEVVLDGGGRIGRLELGLGGVVDRPIAVDTHEVVGAMADGGMVQTFARRIAASLDPMEDHSATADYRRALAQVLTERVVMRAIEAAKSKA